MIVSSSYSEGPPQADGRWYVKEIHETEDQSYSYEYLTDGSLSPQFVMEERASIINKVLRDRENAKLTVIGTSVPLTRYEFLSRFTAAERVAIRELAKTDAIVEDFMEMMKLSGNVSLALASQGLNYIASKGVLSQERADEIGEE